MVLLFHFKTGVLEGCFSKVVMRLNYLNRVFTTYNCFLLPHANVKSFTGCLVAQF